MSINSPPFIEDEKQESIEQAYDYWEVTLPASINSPPFIEDEKQESIEQAFVAGR